MTSADPFVCRKLFDVLNLLAPPTSLMAPRVAARVLLATVPADAGTPWGLVPPVDASGTGTSAHAAGV